MRVARIAADFLDQLRRSLALTPTLSQRERETFWDTFLFRLARSNEPDRGAPQKIPVGLGHLGPNIVLSF